MKLATRLSAAVLALPLLFANRARAAELPCNPNATAVSWSPSSTDYGMLLFEDLWPDSADYDYNDETIAWRFGLVQDAQGNTVAMQANLAVLAVGADLHSGLYFHLPGVPNNAASQILITTTAAAQTSLSPMAGESELVLQLLPDTRELLGGASGFVNTVQTQPGTPAGSISLLIQFATPLQLDIGDAPFDLFIARSDDITHQLHASQFAGTQTMNTALFHTGVDGSTSTEHFINKNKLPFVFSVPQLVAWPREQVSLEKVYPDVLEFAQTGGSDATGWYSSPDVDLTQAWSGSPAPSPTAMDTSFGAQQLSCGEAAPPAWSNIQGVTGSGNLQDDDENGLPLAIDPQGDAWVLPGTRGFAGINIASTIGGAAWQVSQLANTTGDFLGNLAGSSDGTRTAVWYDGTNQIIYAARAAPGADFGPAQIIQSGDVEAPVSIAMEDGDAAALAWVNAEETAVLVSIFDPGSGTWNNLTYPTGTTHVEEPRIAITRSGTQLEAAISYISNPNVVVTPTFWGMFLSWDPTSQTGQFLSPSVLPNTYGFQAAPNDIAIGGAGALIPLTGPAPYNVVVFSAPFGGAWTATDMDDGQTESYNARVAANAAGEAVCVFQSYAGSTYQVEARFFNGGWSDIQLLQGPTDQGVERVGLAMNANGTIIAAWGATESGSGWGIASMRYSHGAWNGLPFFTAPGEIVGGPERIDVMLNNSGLAVMAASSESPERGPEGGTQIIAATLE